MGAAGAPHWPVALLISLFFLWGAANSLNDVLLKQFKKAFVLGDFQASLVQSAFYVGYFTGALPAARAAKAYGFKAAVMAGLCLFSLGCLLFLPASRGGGSFPAFLACLYLAALGLSFLESAANPWLLLLGERHSPGFGLLALNVAQAFNPLGAIAGVLLGRLCILEGKEAELLERGREAARVGPPYLALGLVVAAVALAFLLTSFPLEEADSVAIEMGSGLRRLWKVRGYGHGLLAQLAYVGAQVSAWSFLIPLVQAELPGAGERRGADFVLLALALFMVGRFASSGLLRCVSSECLLLGYAATACACCIVTAALGGRTAVAAVAVASFFMSAMFPTIFGLTLQPLPREDLEVGSALLVMCVVGGALVPPLTGVVSDVSSVGRAYVVPAGCFLVVLSYALRLMLGRSPETGPLLKSRQASAC